MKLTHSFSLNWQIAESKDPNPNVEIKTLFYDHKLANLPTSNHNHNHNNDVTTESRKRPAPEGPVEPVATSNHNNSNDTKKQTTKKRKKSKLSEVKPYLLS